MNLQKELKDYLEGALKRIPEEIMDVMVRSAQQLIDDEIGKTALGEGDKMPDFSLANATGDKINIYDCLSKGPLIITFYRGAWCPYCNLELRAYKELLPQIKAAGANLLAISPELPDTSLSLVEKHGLDFEVLSDVNNEVAKGLGLVFQLNKSLSDIYRSFGNDLDKAQGNTKQELPLPATYVIARDGRVLKAFVDTDYTKRMEPSEALQVLTAMQ